MIPPTNIPDIESEDRLAVSLEGITESVIKPVIRRKLRVSLSPGDTRRDNQDALELVSDVQIILLSELAKAGSGRGSGLRDVNSYAAVVVTNVCYQYLRARFPVRTQQRNKLRYVLSHSDRFGLWNDAHGNWICGYAEWQAERNNETAAFPQHELDSLADARGQSDKATYLRQIKQVFDRTGYPVFLDHLLEILMLKNGLKERHEFIREGVDTDGWLEETINDPRPAIDVLTESADRVNHLWTEIEKLPLPHRKALLLNLKDRKGEGLIAIFPLCGAASIRRIAASLEFSAEEFASIWNSLPWDDLAVARHLGISRQQVINLRQSARARLVRNSV